MDTYTIKKSRTVRLPIGIRVGDDIIKEVGIDEWRLIDTRKISSAKGAGAISDVIARLLQSVGEYQKDRATHMCPPRIVDHMYSADADVILAHALALAKRDKQDVEYKCGKCGKEAIEELSLLGLTVNALGEEDERYIPFELVDGVTVEGMNGPALGKRGRYNYPTLRQTRVSQKNEDSDIDTFCRLLRNCVTHFDHVGNLSDDDVDMFTLDDQNYIFDLVGKEGPGLETVVKSECPHCNHINSLNYDMSRCFLEQRAKKKM